MSTSGKKPSTSAGAKKSSKKAPSKKAASAKKASSATSSKPAKKVARSKPSQVGNRRPTEPIFLEEMAFVPPPAKTRPVVFTKAANAYRAAVKWLDQKD